MIRPALRPLLAALALAACSVNERAARRNAGAECIDCHRPGGKDPDHLFTAGGTVYGSPTAAADGGVGGVEIVIADARGRVVRLTSNEAGNFWTGDRLEFPVSVRAGRPGADGGTGVPSPPCLSGRCNQCHAVPASGGTRGRIAAAP
jgi:hypothetical protein